MCNQGRLIRHSFWFLCVCEVLSVSGEQLLSRHERQFASGGFGIPRLPLYFPQGGSFKIVIGMAFPAMLGTKQTMAWGWNFQFQYQLPQTTNNTLAYPPVVGRKKRTIRNDRSAAYRGIEAMLEKNDINGRSCLLRAICENALDTTYHEANGLYGQLLHITLTPDYGDGEVEPGLDPVYLEAKKAGQYGVDCTTLYQDCQHGNSLLDMISLFDE